MGVWFIQWVTQWDWRTLKQPVWRWLGYGLGCWLWMAVGSAIVLAGDQWVEVIVPKAALWARANQSELPMYESIQGTFFLVVGETDTLWAVETQQEAIAWIKKTDTIQPALRVFPSYDRVGAVTILPDPPRPPPSHPVLSSTPSGPSPTGQDDPLDLRLGPSPQPRVPPKPTPMLPRFPVYVFQPHAEASFLFPKRPPQFAQHIEVDGFIETKVSGRSYNPKIGSVSGTDNRILSIQRDPYYTRLPPDVLLGPLKFDPRLRFDIMARLQEDLNVRFNIEMEPTFPAVYDVGLKYKDHQLDFFKVDTEFSHGEFIRLNRAITGTQYQYKDDSQQVKVAFGQERSTLKRFDSFGNGRRQYSVGVRPILSGSVRVWVNNTPLSEGTDYSVNYFEGEITFTTVKSSTDYIQIVYEFTNPIEDFIPVFSRKDFVGAQWLWQPNKTKRVVLQSSPIQQRLTQKNVSENGAVVLSHKPVVLGSEQLILNGTPLRRDLDYAIRSKKGEITLYRTLLSNDILDIQYQAYQTQSHEQTLIGQNAYGPYQLQSQSIIEDSVVVRVNGKLKSDINDYTIDYDTGRLTFTYPVPYPTVITVGYQSIVSVTQESTLSQSPLSMGVTFLQQSVNTDGSGQIVKVVDEVQQPTSNRFFSANNPITLPDQVEIMIDGVPAPDGAVTLVNAYRGEFNVAPAWVGKTIKLGYQYRKNYQTTGVWMGTGDKVYQHNVHFTLKDTPIKYQGIKKLRVFNGLTDEDLQINQDFSIDYGSNGIDVVMTFFKEGDINPNSNLRSIRKQYPLKDQRITMVYDYAPEVGANSGKLVQKQVGLSLGTQLTDQWRVDMEVSGADNNFSKPRLSTEVSFAGNGTNDNYPLGKRNVVDASELVFVDNVPIARDQDYTINYQLGTIRFLTMVPQPNHTIRVSFSYVDTDAKTTAGQVQAMKFVGKLATSYRWDQWQFRADYKAIDRDYNPLSPIQDRKGTTSWGAGADYRWGAGGLFSADYRRRDEELPRGGNERVVSNHMDDVFFQGQLPPIGGMTLFQTLRYTLYTQDPVGTSPNVYLIDNDLLTAETRVELGPSDQRTQFRRTYSHAVEGVKDGFNRKSTLTDGFDLSGLYTVTHYGVDSLTVRPRYNQSTTLEHALTSGLNTTQFFKNHRSLWGVDSDIQPMRGWTISLGSQTEESFTESNGARSTPNQIINMRIRSQYVPNTWVTFSGGYSQDHQLSALLGQKGKKNTQTDASIEQWSLFGMLTDYGAKPDNPLVSMWKNALLQLNWDERMALENNDLSVNLSSGQGMSLRGFSPIPGVSFPELSVVKQAQDSRVEGTFQTYSKTTTYREYEQRTGRMTLDFPFPVVNQVIYRLDLSDKTEHTRSLRVLTGTSGNQTLEWTPNFKRTQGVTFRPLPFSLGIPILSYGSMLPGIREMDMLLSVPITNPELALDETYEWRESRKLDQLLGGGATSLSQDYATIQSLTTRLGGTAFQWISASSILKLQSEWYRRNVMQTNTGVTFRPGLDTNVSVRIPFPSLFGFKVDVNVSGVLGVVEQYRSPVLDITEETLRNPLIRRDAQRFTDYTQRSNQSITGMTSINPFVSWLTIRGGYGTTRVVETQETPSLYTNTLFTDDTITAGTGVTIWDGFQIGYDYSMKASRQGQSPSQLGYVGVLNASYTPIRTDWLNVTATYTRTDSWGTQLNTLQQNEYLRGTDDLIKTALVQRSDTVHVGNLNMNIMIPIKGSPYIKNVTITGEGYIKILTNNMDPTYKQVGLPELSYDVSGVVIKATLNF